MFVNCLYFLWTVSVIHPFWRKNTVYIYTVIYNVQISSLLLNKHAYVNWIYLAFLHVFYNFYILKSVLHCSLQLVSIGMSSSFSLVSYVYKPIIWVAIYKLYFTYICSLIYNISIIFTKQNVLSCAYIFAHAMKKLLLIFTCCHYFE